MVTQMEVLIYVRTKGKASTKEIIEHFEHQYPQRDVERSCMVTYGSSLHHDRLRRSIYQMLYKLQQKNQLKVVDKTHYLGNIWTVA